MVTTHDVDEVICGLEMATEAARRAKRVLEELGVQPEGQLRIVRATTRSALNRISQHYPEATPTR